MHSDFDINQYYKETYNTVYHILRNRYDSEDIVQETYRQILEDMVDENDLDLLREKLISTATQLAKAHKQEKKLELYHFDHPTSSLHATSDDVFAYRESLKRFLRKEIYRLSPEYSQIIFLHYFENLSQEMIATQMGLPIKLVYDRLKNAEELLRQKFTFE